MASGKDVGTTAPHVLVFPYPAQGHMLPLLDLAHHLSARGLSITVLITPGNHHLLRPLLSRAPSIRTLVLPLSPSPSLPPGVENTKDLPPRLFLSLKHALGSLHDPIVRWAQSAVPPPDLIVSDFFCGWTQRVAAELGIKRVTFCPSGALFLSIIHCLWREMPQRPDPADDEFPVAFPWIPRSPVYPWCHLSSNYREYRAGEEAWEFVRQGFLDNTASWGYVLNTFSELEGTYLRHLRVDLPHTNVWAVGPLAPLGGGDRGGALEVTPEARAAMDWLDGCPAGSVVYVCFGSQITLTQQQTDVVGAALERSGARFIWCVREPPAEAGDGSGRKYGRVSEVFEERTAGQGVVLRSWAPQVAILGHPAVGAFLTHCGWNSVLEGVVAGVVLLTWPMGADQFVNARLLVEEAGVGMRTSEGKDAVPDPEELARLVAESVTGRSAKLTAARLRRAALEAVGAGGSSDGDMGELVAAIWRLKHARLSS